jgi:Tol biopolymer transport system component
MKKRRHSTGYLFGLALALVSLASAAMAQGVAPKQNGKIAFTDLSDFSDFPYRHSGISVINPDGSGRTQLTATQILCPQPNLPPGSCGPDHLDYSPSWSPDGKQIAFIRSVPAPNRYDADVFVMNADGSNQRRLTQSGTGEYVAHPTWSPDGTKIAFVGPAAGVGLSLQIYVMNADGSNKHPVGEGQNPAWSPDGSKLAFPFNSFDSDNGIHVMNADGSGRTKITTPKDPIPGSPWDADWDPVWSPDGMRILFVRYVGCEEDNGCQSITVWTVNADGSNLANVANIAAAGLAWSPDGTKIVFRWMCIACLLGGVGDDDRDGDLFTMEPDGSHITRLTNTPGEYESEPSWQPVALAPPDNNPINDAQFFVRQQYRDFLNREPDPGGLVFWTNEITLCGADQQCLEAKRINVSAAFFLSIEFQQTGYLVYRIYKASYGDLPGAPVPIRRSEFMPDTQEIGQGVIVNQAGWEQVLENNKQAFTAEFVQRSRFTSAYPTSLTPDQFVDQLFINSGVAPSAEDRALAINEFSGAGTSGDAASRARALRRVAENSAVVEQEFNRAFVLTQYFGYLHRNPNDPPELTLDFQGYNFWLTKLNQFNGDYVGAEMVRAFITSGEYRQRFGS